MFRIIEQVFVVLLGFSKSLVSRVNVPDHVYCTSLDNQQYITQPNLNNLHPNEYIQGLSYYLFAVNLDKCIVIFLMIYLIEYVFETKQKI